MQFCVSYLPLLLQEPPVLTAFESLILVKVFREDSLVAAIGHYVTESLGSEFVSFQPVALPDVYPDTKATVPTIFILSPGTKACTPRYKMMHGSVNLSTLLTSFQPTHKNPQFVQSLPESNAVLNPLVLYTYSDGNSIKIWVMEYTQYAFMHA